MYYYIIKTLQIQLHVRYVIVIVIQQCVYLQAEIFLCWI